jgi:hypothetical protein
MAAAVETCTASGVALAAAACLFFDSADLPHALANRLRTATSSAMAGRGNLFREVMPTHSSFSANGSS